MPIMFKPNVEEGIRRAAEETKTPYELLKTFAHIESGGNAMAGGKGSVRGLYQLTNELGRDYKLIGPGFDNRVDPYISSVATSKLIGQYKHTLQDKGLEVTPFNLYMLHYFGQAGGPDMIKAWQNGDNNFNKSYRGMTIDYMIKNNNDGHNPGVVKFMNDTKNRFDKSWNGVTGGNAPQSDFYVNKEQFAGEVPHGHFGQNFEIPQLGEASLPLALGVGALAGGALGRAGTPDPRAKTMATVGGALGGAAMGMGAAGVFNKMASTTFDKAAALKDDIKLQDHQDRVKELMKDNDAMLFYHGLGSGKSLSSLASTEGLPANIIVPAPLRENYRNEVRKFLTSDEEPKKNIVSYDHATNNKLNPRDALIMDEAHRIGDPETARFREIYPQAVSHDKRILLTGTPIKNYPHELASLAAILNGREVLPLNKKDFYDKFIERREVDPGLVGRLIGVKPGIEEVPKNLDEIRAAFRGKVDYQPSSEEGFPEKKFITREVPMSDEQQEIYKFVTNKADPYLAYKIKHNLPPSKQELSSLNAFMTAARMVSNSTKPYGGTEETSNKIKTIVQDFLDRASTNPDHKGVIYSNYLDGGLKPIDEELQRNGIRSKIFDGSLSDKERRQIIDDYNNNKLQALLISSAGTEGLNLKGTRSVQLTEPHFNDVKLDQAIGRGARFKSHDHLPEEDRNVEVMKYMSTIKPSILDKAFGKSPMSADQYLYNLSERKRKLNDKFLDVLKEEGSRGRAL